MADQLVVFVNGSKFTIKHVDPEVTLLNYLRNNLRLVGTKEGCGQGGCGSCTVMVSEYDAGMKTIRYYSVMACLVPLCSLHGKAVTTVEGIGNAKTRMHPVQERLAKAHGVQCGFCSPGMVMSMYTLLRNNPEPSMREICTALQGNLCRCTGYRPILQANATFAKEVSCPAGSACCKNRKSAEKKETVIPSATYEPTKFMPYDPTQDPIFPSELQLHDYAKESKTFRGQNVTYHQPSSLDEVFSLLQQHPGANIVAGCTAIAHQIQKGSIPHVINIANLKRLKDVVQTEDGVTVGAALSLTDVQKNLDEIVNKTEATKTRALKELRDIIGRIAATQVRNLGSIGGNISSCRPSHDLAAWLIAAKCKLHISSKDSSRELQMDQSFFVDGATSMKAGELLSAIHIPFTNEGYHYKAYKHAKRPDFDWSVLSAGMSVQFKLQTTTIGQLVLAFGNLGLPVFVAEKTCKIAEEREWDDSLLKDLTASLSEEIDIHSQSVAEGVTPFKQTLACGFLTKFFSSVNDEVAGRKSVTTCDHYCATQVFEEVPEGQAKEDAIGRPIVHLAAKECTTGEARFIDDIPRYEDELHAAPVLSTKAHAKILHVDPSPALDLPGVVCYIDHNDVPNKETFGLIAKDEEAFASDMVTCEGMPIGAIIAKDQITARKAAKRVRVTYEEMRPILTVEDAKKADPGREPMYTLKEGNMDDGFKASDRIIEGEVRIEAQEHFYMEPNSSIAVPSGESDEMDVYHTTQSILHMHGVASTVLGVGKNKINMKVKRIGGGFGGKENRGAVCMVPCLVGAYKLKRPVRCVLSREEDMLATGTRHPVLYKYKVGVTKDGKLQALEVESHVNAGYCMDITIAVSQYTILDLENCYKIPNMLAKCYIWLTNTQCATSFRGFGQPQASFGIETIIERIAVELGIPQDEVRERNFFKEGDTNVCGMVMENMSLNQCWEDCRKQCDYTKARTEIEQFNRENEWTKRGIAMHPTKFHVITLRPSFLNQGHALLHVYLDGTVLIQHAGVEMGQGVYTKLVQLASRELGISRDLIHIRETTTSHIPNPIPSVASFTTDLQGGALKDACEKLMTKLQPFREKDPNSTWKDWVVAAFQNHINLTTTGFFSIKDIHFDWKTSQGKICDHYTYGVACSQVEVDCLTGAHKILKTDIVMDVGRSLNPAIDIGQIEGAFMMGYGLYMIEEHLHNTDGKLLTKNPHTYKIPTIGTLPKEFNVTILKGMRNKSPKALYSSKGIGEPPLVLSLSVLMAVKEAIKARRRDNGRPEFFRLDSPATSEKIRMACGDSLTIYTTN